MNILLFEQNNHVKITTITIKIFNCFFYWIFVEHFFHKVLKIHQNLKILISKF